MEKMTYGSLEMLPQPASRIVFGTAVDPMTAGENADALLDGAAERGINFFDCARSYGRAEEVLGGWIRRRGNREKVIVLTKCGDIRNGIVKVNRQVILEQLETSLKTLQTDYIDVFLLHRDDPETPLSEIMETLHDVKREGKIRLFGVSNWTVDRIREANLYALRNRIEDFSVSSPNYGLALQMDDLWGGGCVSVSGPEHQAGPGLFQRQIPRRRSGRCKTRTGHLRAEGISLSGEPGAAEAGGRDGAAEGNHGAGDCDALCVCQSHEPVCRSQHHEGGAAGQQHPGRGQPADGGRSKMAGRGRYGPCINLRLTDMRR